MNVQGKRQTKKSKGGQSVNESRQFHNLLEIYVKSTGLWIAIFVEILDITAENNVTLIKPGGYHRIKTV